MKKIICSIVLILVLTSVPAIAGGYDFYFFGVNLETFKTKNLNYPAAILGGLTAAAVHIGSHYAYAGLTHMSVTQCGFEERIPYGYSDQQYREFATVGHFGQALVGLLLTSIPATRQTSFTKGYVIWETIDVSTYPLLCTGSKGDINMSRQFGGSDWEHAGYSAIAIHNLLRINWKAGE